MMYGKIFAQTFSGSMYGAGAPVFATWSYCISNADWNSHIELNPRVLADTIGMTTDDAQGAIDYLCAADPESRTKTEDGRRLVHVGGFMYRLVNHSCYRAIRNEEERKVYMRDAKRRSRSRKDIAGKE